MSKQKTITVAGHFGDKQVTRNEFVEIWERQTKSLIRVLDYESPTYDEDYQWIQKTTQKVMQMAGESFDLIYKRENS